MPKKETQQKSFILRIDEPTMRAVEAWAADEFRSVNGQLQWIVSDALRRARRLPKGNNKKQEDNETERTD